jgi:tRNA-dihydrouridine synthase C
MGTESLKIILAPMEGVVDPVIRQLLTEIGGIDYCVTEFIRVTANINPDKIFYKYCPELKNQSRTKSGVPVFVQLLGSDLQAMAENAHKVSELGAYGVDINFGCPAKTVNRHDGGSVLLKNPERVFKITESVRKAVPKDIPVTIKVRLGYQDKSLCQDIALAAESAGAHWLTVHARTKEEGYRPPAHWQYIAQMKSKIKIPVIANGEIWNIEDHKSCQEISECTDTMIGRGLMACPDLALQIKSGAQAKDFISLKNYIFSFIEESVIYQNDKYALHRTKQLLKLLSRNYSFAHSLFEQIKREKELLEIKNQIQLFFRNIEILA